MFCCEFCNEISGQISIHSLVSHTYLHQQREGLWKGKGTEKCLKGRQLLVMEFHLPQNTLLLGQDFASQVAEKIRHQESSALVNLAVLP